ncbi:uncharacterized protein LOC116201944 [Punica granatum]|uniref:Uncharacterized protein LOC116201944 n=1 Tax=Punica granatum TaxID=22663 RepID=A0A218VZM1_PUNGR|nr:uncharacterized protein LOC116201944 [Punica granatum]OWM66024.1 hypothetical protein CDL15_Pgr015450 [Punica granatum]
MTSKREPSLSSVPYDALPPQNVVVLVPYPRRPGRHRLLSRCLYGGAALLLLAVAVFFLFPSDPTVQLSRIHLNHVRVNSSPSLTLDLSFSLTIKVRNKDFFSLYYDSLLVSVGYRGRELGVVTSEGEKIKARGSSYVNATLDLDGLEVVHDVIYLIEDLSKGVIPFDTISQVEGKLGLFFFSVPIKAKVSCEVYVNTKNQTIVHQDCSPE